MDVQINMIKDKNIVPAFLHTNNYPAKNKILTSHLKNYYNPDQIVSQNSGVQDPKPTII